jgi:hypothetical protein
MIQCLRYSSHRKFWNQILDISHCFCKLEKHPLRGVIDWKWCIELTQQSLDFYGGRVTFRLIVNMFDVHDLCKFMLNGGYAF